MIIGYMPSGCLEGARQSSIRAISKGVCSSCIWELKPEVCNDAKSGVWARKLELLCDWIGLEGDWAVDERRGDNCVRIPVVTALDPQVWSPSLDIPDEFKMRRSPGEIIVFHSFANSKVRRTEGRDIKGSSAVHRAIEALQNRGINVRLFYATQIPSEHLRFYQAQADIVIDQLNYGRIGANARESMMLGKPLITRLDATQEAPIPPLRTILEAPAFDASERNIEKVLLGLVQSKSKWPEYGRQGREFALRWYAADRCAARFETVIDRIERGLSPEDESLVP